MVGDPDLQAEVLFAYEAGYRIIPSPSLSMDVAFFYNTYDHLRSNLDEAPVPVLDGIPHVELPMRMSDDIEAETRGAELAMEWRALKNLRLHGAYSYYDEERRLLVGDVRINPNYLNSATPQHHVSLRAATDLTRDVEFDLWLKYTSDIPAMGIDDILNLDARLGWHCTKQCEISLVGQNLLQPEVNEFRDTWLGSRTAWIQRGVYGRVVFWF